MQPSAILRLSAGKVLMAQGSRPDRIADQLRAEIGSLLTRHVKDPGLGFVTVTRVRMTPDLQIARVYYTALGDAASLKRTERALERAKPFLRAQVGRRVRLRRVPALEFFFDTSIEQQNRLEQLFQEIHAADAGSEGQPPDSDADESDRG